MKNPVTRNEANSKVFDLSDFFAKFSKYRNLFFDPLKNREQCKTKLGSLPSHSCHLILRVMLCGIFILALIWTSAAFAFQMLDHPYLMTAILIIWWLFGVFGVFMIFRQAKRTASFISLLMLIVFLAFWSNIKPSLDRDWQPSVAKTVEGHIVNNIAYVKNIRDFDWNSPTSGEIRWIEQSYDLNQIIAIDLYLTYWMGPAIAHSLISFSFSDGHHLVFSAEIRRERGENFSFLGGFFRQFELAMIGATEEDIIKLRTDIRKEHVYRYSLRGTREMAQNLFISYLEKANDLAKNPVFYNTLTANCTTVIFDMAHVLDHSIPLDWRIVFSGQLPSYLYAHNFIDASSPLEDTIKKAYVKPQNLKPRDDYSRLIRMQPGLE